MNQKSDAMRFVKQQLKYTAAKRYVGTITANDISTLWLDIKRSEFENMAYTLSCCNISVASLRAAFLRQMSYNPLRFEDVDLSSEGKYDANTTKIVNHIKKVLKNFETIWPNGISGGIYISGFSDRRYIFMCDMRDCFKEIARQNVDDLKDKVYCDEIIAHFAAATDINMSMDIRKQLQEFAAATSEQRHLRQEIRKLDGRISELERIENLNHTDKEIVVEVRGELKELNKQREQVAAKLKEVERFQTKPKLVSKNIPTYEAVYQDDAAEREEELLRSLTPQHTTDEIFCDYLKRTLNK